ncbi:MAG: DUF4347 domain-containing protein, partial [Methylococcaceae bacterium]
MPTSIVFIDEKVSDYQNLIASLGNNIEIQLLNPNKDGLLQIAKALQNRHDLDAIHIVSHGSSGGLSLGSSLLNSNNLSFYSNALTTIRSALTENGDILLYGCNIAQGETGLNFINNLAQLTAADIAASTNLTGNSALGGDWLLEQSTGTIEATAPFNSAILSDYSGVLSDDFDNTVKTKGEISTVITTITITGTIEIESDQDWFKVNLTKGITYIIDLKGDTTSTTSTTSLSDPYFYGIYKSTGKPLDVAYRNDDSNGSSNSQVIFTPSSGGNYYLAAGAFGTNTGAYQLSVSIASTVSDDFAANTTSVSPTTGSIALTAGSGSVTGIIETTGDEDWFKVSLIAGTKYVIDLEGLSTSKGTLSDPYFLGIYDSTSKYLGYSNDDSGSGTNAQVAFMPTSSGDYYLDAAALSSVTGNYKLSITSFTDSYTADSTTVGTLIVGNAVSSNIDISSDEDWFKVALNAGTTYQIDLEGSDSSNGTLNNPYFRGIYDNAGVFLGFSDDDSGVGNNAQVLFTPTTAGNYYLNAGTADDKTGSYQLSIIASDYPADNTTTALIATVPSSALGAIDKAYDRDWFKISLVANVEYLIDLEGFDTGKGTLSNPLFNGITDSQELFLNYNNDDNGVNHNAQKVFIPTATGDYYLDAGAIGDGTGSYRLSVSIIDYAADSSTLGAIDTLPGFVNNTIGFATDQDWFKVSLVAGITYIIDLEGSATSKGTLSNPYFRGIYNNTSVFLGYSDNNSGSNNNAHATFIPTSSGDYYLAAGAGGNNTGTYQLSVTPKDFYPIDTSTTGVITLTAGSGSVSSAIETSGDQDWFKVSLVAGTSYRIDLEGANTSKGSLTDPYFRGIYDSSKKLLDNTYNDDNGLNFNSEVTFTPTTAGDYYFSAGAAGNNIGSYQLSVAISTVTTTSGLVHTKHNHHISKLVDGDDYDQYISTTSTTGLIDFTKSNVATGTISSNPSNDQDWFKVSLVAGTSYLINLEGSSTSTGTLTDPYFYGIYNSAGDPLGFANDNNAGTLNAQTLFKPSISGDYYLAAGAVDKNTGTYQLSVSISNDDYIANSSNTGLIEGAGSSKGTIETASDQDWFKIALTKGQAYIIDLEGSPSSKGSLSDPYFRGIYDSSSHFLGYSNDDNGVNANSEITFIAPATDDYYLAAGAVGTSTGTYQLSVSLPATANDYVATTATSAVISSVPNSATGIIETQSDEDWFKVFLTKGVNYVIDLEGTATGKGSLADPYLYGIYDSTATLVNNGSDDGGVGTNSRLGFTPTVSGNYYLDAGAYASNTGNYQLSVSLAADDYVANTASTGVISTLVNTVTGNIEIASDKDWFKAHLEQGTQYLISLEASATSKGSLDNPYFGGIYDSAGLSLGYSDDNGGQAGNAQITFTPSTTGDYYLEAAAVGTLKGTYQLSVVVNHKPIISAPISTTTSSSNTYYVIDLLTGASDADADSLSIVALNNDNLLTNSGAESSNFIEGWSVQNAGQGWAMTNETHSGNRALISSYALGTLSQEVDLIAKGYSSSVLDNAPAIDVSTFVRGFSSGGGNSSNYYHDNFQLTVSLLNINHQVITSYTTGTQISNVDWLKVAHTFINYGSGVRYVRFSESARDVEYWYGNYGAIFDDASVSLQTITLPLLTNGDAETGGFNGWTESAGTWVITTQAHNGGDAFISSNTMDSLSQDIDLLAKGYSSAYLDSAPSIDVATFVKGFAGDASNGATADPYQVVVSLLNANHQVIVSYDTGLQTSSADWLQIAHSFTDYGAGVRYVRFVETGRDAENRTGNYGAIFDDASVNIALPNLLANPNFETSSLIDGWTVTNGGDGWAISNQTHNGGQAFISSYDWCSLSQDIDLVSKGYASNYLDSAPTIDVGTYVKGYSGDNGYWNDSGFKDYYQVIVSLLDANRNVISTYDTGVQQANANKDWTHITHSFSHYGTGVRYVSFVESGKSVEHQAGNYGAIFDDASVQLPSKLPTGANLSGSLLTLNPSLLSGQSQVVIPYGISDGKTTISQTATVNLSALVNSAPLIHDNYIVTNLNSYSFTSNDFSFVDTNSPANSLLNVIITRLPIKGTLKLNNTAVTVGQIISASSISNNQLIFQGASPYADFGFKVQDNGGWANGGFDTSTPATKYMVTGANDLSGVNDPPIAVNGTIAFSYDNTQNYHFLPDDFYILDTDSVVLGTGDNLSSIIIESLPTGQLSLNGVAVKVNDTINVTNMLTGAFTYKPFSNSSLSDSFTFKVVDDGGTLNGGVDTSNNIATESISIDPVPSATPLTSTTSQGLASYNLNLLQNTSDSAPNLIVNSGFENNTTANWTVTNAGSGWAISSNAHSSTHAVISSYALGSLSQDIDLVANGYSSNTLNNAPIINTSVYVKGYSSDGAASRYADKYEMIVSLLDANHQLISTYDTGLQTANSSWLQVAHSFSNYGAGVRYVRLVLKGQDVEHWAGNYGAIFDDASVSVQSLSVNTNLLTDPGAENNTIGWTVANAAQGWSCNGEAHSGNHAFSSSYLKETLSQTIDLVAKGYASSVLDTAPTIDVGTFVKGYAADNSVPSRYNDNYQIVVSLLNANKQTIITYDTGLQTTSSIWQEVKHSFSNYGAGVRYITFSQSGDDIENWIGHYGTIFDDAYVKIDSLPTGVSLTNNTLTFNPSDPAYTSLKSGDTQTITVPYTISDDRATVSQTATITINGINDAPKGADNNAVSTLENTAYTFNSADFNFSDVDGNTLSNIVLTNLPLVLSGSLQLNGIPLTAPQSISKIQLDNGALTFMPVVNASGTNYASFGFKVQ